LLGGSGVCGLAFLFVGIVSSGSDWALDISDSGQSWSVAIWPTLAGIACLTGAMNFGLPKRIMGASFATLLFLLLLGAAAARSNVGPSSTFTNPVAKPLDYEHAATAGMAGLAFLEAFFLGTLFLARQMGFSFAHPSGRPEGLTEAAATGSGADRARLILDP
jgi:hypothetical protein